jgi:predicted phosphodiesterase
MRSQVKAVADGKLDKRNYQEVFNKHGNMFPIEGLSGLNITLSGVTVTADDESGVFTLNGTATTSNSIEIVTRGTEYGVVKGGEKYLAQLKYISGECSDFANGKPNLLFGNITSGNLRSPWVVTDNSVRVSIEPSEDIILNRLAIGITAGVTYTNLRIAPYLALESEFNNDYEGGAYKFCADNLDVNIEKTIDAKISSFNNNLDGQLVPYMRDEAKRVNREAITENVDLNFIAFADPHLFDANKYTKYAKLMGLGGVDFMIGLGDYAPYAMQERKDRIVELSNYLSMAGRGKDCFFAVGNHELDTLADGGTLTKKELHRSLCSHLNGVVKFNELDPYGCYYYVDYDVAKVRVIVLNTSDMYDESGSYTNPNNSSLMMHQRQLTWFTETALNFKDKTAPSEWSVLTFGHTCWPFGGSPLQTILSAVKNGTALNQTWTVGGYTLSVDADYSTQGAVSVIGNIMGHSHNDVSEKSKEINCIQLRADNNVLDIPYTVAVDGLTAGAYFITADNGKKYGCTISTDYPAAKFISYNYSTVIVSRLTYMGLLILDENKMKIGEVRFTEADYNTSMTELTGFVADRVEGTATTESCYIININKENRTVTAIPYGVGCSGVIATY